MTSEPMTLGQADANIYNCPTCARPMATSRGLQRCPGCGTRLLLATPISRVSVFVSAGLAVGLLFALTLSAAAGALTGPRTTGPGASAVPGSSSAPGVRPTALPSIAPASRAALGQLAALDARLASVAAPLRVALRDKDLDSAAVADLLRSLAADAAFGDDLASRLGTWDQAYALSLDLSNQYGSIRSTAREGLAASITNDPAYRATAQKMIAVLAGVAPLDKRLRDLARVADVPLPGNSPSPAPR
jgi:DNA-directed RNA polymerase subunit RPC12/RpoP